MHMRLHACVLPKMAGDALAYSCLTAMDELEFEEEDPRRMTT